MRDSVVFYRSFWEAIKKLPEADRLESLTAIIEYGLDGTEPSPSGVAAAMFLMAKPQIDANNRRYQNGTKGGRPVTKPKPNGNQEITKPEPNEKEKVKEKDKEKEKNIYCARFEQLWLAYPRKKEKAAAYKAYKARLADGFSEDELETAVKRYAKECELLETEEQYIKHPATFLGVNTPFLDFLRTDYKPPNPKKQNKFHNFDPAGDDYDAIVNELYGPKNPCG